MSRMAAVPPGNPSASTTYTFASQPRAVSGSRKKYRDPNNQLKKSNKRPIGHMMFDSRIVRGCTYRQQTLPASEQVDPLELQRKQEAARRRQAYKRAQEKARLRTPPAVDGRKHMDVQTELYLEELTDQVEEADEQTQTDPFLDRPPSPLFIPPKTGVDVATQILTGELFDFDIEVKPILEVLVGKTLEQALMETMEEEELEELRKHQRQFEDIRAAELAEMQRLEENARRREAEKEARIAEQRTALQQQKETSEKIAARAFAQSYLSSLVPSVFSSLDDHGFFFDQQEREVETDVIPWLMDAVDSKLDAFSTGQQLLDNIIQDVVQRRKELWQAAEPKRPPTVQITLAADENITDMVDEGTVDGAPSSEEADGNDKSENDEKPGGVDESAPDESHLSNPQLYSESKNENADVDESEKQISDTVANGSDTIVQNENDRLTPDMNDNDVLDDENNATLISEENGNDDSREQNTNDPSSTGNGEIPVTVNIEENLAREEE